MNNMALIVFSPFVLQVMQIKNNYEKNVFNGGMGTIVEVKTQDKAMVVNFDGQLVQYDATELDQIVLAYAATVHKAQGSEYKVGSACQRADDYFFQC